MLQNSGCWKGAPLHFAVPWRPAPEVIVKRSGRLTNKRLLFELENLMAKYFNIEKLSEAEGVVELRISFGVAAQNPQIVPDAVAALRDLKLTGGKLVKFNGPGTLPVAMALAHEVGHLFGAVACFDPKIAPGYVVCITHDPKFELGQQLP